MKKSAFLSALLIGVMQMNFANAEPDPKIVVNVSGSASAPSQQQEITAILRELEYLREVAQNLSVKHANDRSKIRFNYAALIRQLLATEDGIRAYLNAEINTIRTTEPKPVDTQLFQVRQN